MDLERSLHVPGFRMSYYSYEYIIIYLLCVKCIRPEIEKNFLYVFAFPICISIQISLYWNYGINIFYYLMNMELFRPIYFHYLDVSIDFVCSFCYIWFIGHRLEDIWRIFDSGKM